MDNIIRLHFGKRTVCLGRREANGPMAQAGLKKEYPFKRQVRTSQLAIMQMPESCKKYVLKQSAFWLFKSLAFLGLKEKIS